MTMQANPTKGEIIDLGKSYWDAMKSKDGGRPHGGTVREDQSGHRLPKA